MARQNRLWGGVADHARKDFTPTHVGDNPKIYTGCAMSGGKDNLKGYPSKDKEKLKMDLLIRELWT